MRKKGHQPEALLARDEAGQELGCLPITFALNAETPEAYSPHSPTT